MSIVKAGLASSSNRRRNIKLVALLSPGFVLIILPFIAALMMLGAYSLNAHDMAGDGPGLSLWHTFLSDSFNWQVIWRSLWIAGLTSVITLLIAYPVAAALLQIRNRFYLAFAYVALFSPLLVSVISRSYGWLLLLSDTGFINQLLGLFGLGPFHLVFNVTGVVIALVHVLLPYAVLPLLNIMTQIPNTYREAALDLGGSEWTVFFKVTLPLTLPGVIVALKIIFALSISAFVTPSLLGGGRVLTLSRMLYDNIVLLEWGTAAVQALVLLTTTLAVLFVLERVNRSTHIAREE